MGCRSGNHSRCHDLAGDAGHDSGLLLGAVRQSAAAGRLPLISFWGSALLRPDDHATALGLAGCRHPFGIGDNLGKPDRTRLWDAPAPDGGHHVWDFCFARRAGVQRSRKHIFGALYRPGSGGSVDRDSAALCRYVHLAVGQRPVRTLPLSDHLHSQLRLYHAAADRRHGLADQ